MPIPGVGVADLKKKRLNWFRKEAVSRGRLTLRSANDDHGSLIEKLRLREGEFLKRAAVLLFHPEPEAFFTGAFVKIGYFKTDSDLRFQDVIQGDVFTQVDKTMDLLMTKYLQAAVQIEGTRHTERLPVPEEALREAVVNAIAHKDYASGAPIQISVYDDKLMIWNSGKLPEDWTIDRLYTKHPSIPNNPDVAGQMFRVGNIEAWGSGIDRMISACDQHGCPSPVFEYETIGLMLTLGYQDHVGTKSGPGWDQAGTKLALSRHQAAVLSNCLTPKSLSELLSIAGRSNRTKFRNQVLVPLLDGGLLEMTVPDKPSSPLQKYRTTASGTAAVHE